MEALEAPAGTLVVMDRGVATDACVTWLRDNGYRYLVVSRERHRRFDAAAAVSLQTQSDQTVHMHKVVSTDPDEVRLQCYSEEQRGIVERFAARFETALDEAQRRAVAPPRAQAPRPGLAAHRAEDQAFPRRLALPGRRHLDPPPPGRLDGYPSGRLLPARSETDWDEDALWRTYTTLTDVEAVFRSLKSELGLRPIYHRKPARADGHLFITGLPARAGHPHAAAGEHASWTTLRLLEGAARHRHLPPPRWTHADVRTATQAEPDQRAIYDGSAEAASARRSSDPPISPACARL